MPNSLTTIGSSVFKNCTSLTNATISNSLATTGKYTFQGCTSLTNVTIPNSVTNIDDYAFSGCTSLTTITIPNSITTIENNSFEGCNNLTSVILNSDAIVSQDYTSSSNIKQMFGTQVSKYILGEQIKRVGDYAFYGCDQISSITISNGVTKIGEHAFRGCTGLTSITIPGSVTTIGKNAFQSCSGLTSAIFESNVTASANPNSMTTIEERAFYSCSNLTSISISNNVNNIGMNAFQGCNNLTSVKLESDALVSADHTSSDRGRFRFVFGTQVKEYILDEQVKSIGKYTFSNCYNLTKVEGLDHIQAIGDSAFFYCDSLKAISLDSVKTIKNSAFQNCTGLVSVALGKELVDCGKDVFNGCTKIEKVSLSCANVEDWFQGLEAIKELTVNESVEAIKDGAFSNCTGLTTAQIKGSKEIGNSAFSGCSSLSDITLPESLSRMGNSAFSGCNSLVSVDIPDNVSSIGESTFEGCTRLDSISIPAKVTIINHHTFKDCIGLQSIEIPNHIKTIGNKPFDGCVNLKSVSINSVFDYYKGYHQSTGNYDLTARPTYSDVFGAQVTSYILGENIETITYQAFSSNKTMASLTIGSRVKEVERNALSTCSNLKKIVIKDIKSWCGVKIATDGKTNLFATNHHLYADEDNEITDLVIPDGVETINDYVFYGCNNISSVYIPSSITKIYNAFQGCEQLKKVIISDLAAWCGISFENSGDNPLSIAHHLYNEDGTEIKDLMIPEGIDSIKKYTFFGGNAFTSVSIPSSLKSIESYAFSNCTALSKVIIDDLAAWCSIDFGDNPLSYAHRLYNNDGTEIQDLTVPAGIESVSYNAFSGCESLKSLVISNGIEYVGGRAFADCSNLATVVIPNSVKNIGYEAFANCMSLYSVTSLINIPFNLEESAFRYTNYDYDKDIIYMAATLYVPRGRVAMYSNIEGWKKFLNIVETDTKFNLTYVVDGEVYKTYEIQATEVVTPEPDPYKEGYIFSGWTAIPSVMPAHNITVYGSFSADPNSAGVESINYDGINPKSYYTIDGHRYESQQKGLNIIRMSDGTVKKAVLK